MFRFALRQCVRRCSTAMGKEKTAMANEKTAMANEKTAMANESSNQAAEGEPAIAWAFNHVEKKKGLFKPKHSVEEQIRYMQSKAYEMAYKGVPVHRWYRRNVKGQWIMQPPPRMFCIDKIGKFNVNHACPICRDEYLFFDYRNPTLIEQFLLPGTDQPMPLIRTGLCREQYQNLQAQLLKSREHGTVMFSVPFRDYDYAQYYAWWPKNDQMKVDRHGLSLTDIRAQPLIEWPEHNRDSGRDWDEWWLRYDKFVRKGK